MVVKTQLIRNLNKSLKQLLAVMMVISIAIPQNLFANPGADGTENNALSSERLDFAKAITPERATELGLKSNSVLTMNTSSLTNGKKVDVDVVQFEFAKGDAKKVLQALLDLEPQLRKSYAETPDEKTMFTYIAPESEKEVLFEGLQALEFFKGLDKNTAFYKKYIKTSIWEGVKNYYRTLTDPKTKVDYYLTLMRFGFSGGSATFSLFVSGIPIPISGMIGMANYGGGSSGVGFFIDEYTRWLDNNIVNPSRKIRNRLGSIETYMMTSPLLIGMQNTGIFNADGAAYLAGYLGISALVQNIYFEVKRRSPKAAMWYKWKATEALFLASGTLLLPIWNIYTVNAIDSIISTYKYSAASTLSQGVWDIFLTNARRPLLEKAIAKDQAEYQQRVDGKNLIDDKAERYKTVHREEIKVRDRFKPFFFGASLVSVFSAIAGTSGHNMNNEVLITTGFVGMLTLGTTGFLTWWWYSGGPQRMWSNTKAIFDRVRGTSKEKVSSSSSTELNSNIRTCSSLFAM